VAISSRAIKTARQETVARLNLRGMTQREIEKALRNQKMINPRTGKPWSLGTINADLQEMEEAWQASALASRQKLKNRSNAELEEMKRQAWKDGDIRLALEIRREQNKLFALYDPIELSVSGNMTHTHQMGLLEDAVAGMEEDELDALIADLFVIADVDMEALPAVIDGEYEVED